MILSHHRSFWVIENLNKMTQWGRLSCLLGGSLDLKVLRVIRKCVFIGLYSSNFCEYFFHPIVYNHHIAACLTSKQGDQQDLMSVEVVKKQLFSIQIQFFYYSRVCHIQRQTFREDNGNEIHFRRPYFTVSKPEIRGWLEGPNNSSCLPLSLLSLVRPECLIYLFQCLWSNLA